MELSGSKIKKVIIFSQRKSFFHISRNISFSKNSLYFRSKLSELKKQKEPSPKNFVIFQ